MITRFVYPGRVFHRRHLLLHIGRCLQRPVSPSIQEVYDPLYHHRVARDLSSQLMCLTPGLSADNCVAAHGRGGLGEALETEGGCSIGASISGVHRSSAGTVSLPTSRASLQMVIDRLLTLLPHPLHTDEYPLEPPDLWSARMSVWEKSRTAVPTAACRCPTVHAAAAALILLESTTYRRR